MMRNLFVSFYIHDISREASLILGGIEELGDAVRIYGYVWYVRSGLTAADAASRLWDLMEASDSIVVIDASSNEVATFNLSEAALERMGAFWHQELVMPASPVRLRAVVG